MKQFVAIESATGNVYVVTAHDQEHAYRVFGRDVLHMPDPIDTGNVDIDLYPVPPADRAGALRVGLADTDK